MWRHKLSFGQAPRRYINFSLSFVIVCFFLNFFWLTWKKTTYWQVKLKITPTFPWLRKMELGIVGNKKCSFTKWKQLANFFFFFFEAITMENCYQTLLIEDLQNTLNLPLKWYLVKSSTVCMPLYCHR